MRNRLQNSGAADHEMAPILKLIAGRKVFHLDGPDTFNVVPMGTNNLVAELNISVQFVFFGDHSKVLQYLWSI